VPAAWTGPALAIAAYLSGSISLAWRMARRHGVDLSNVGSGNPGATNVGRVLGKKAGRIVLIFDLLKGALPYGAARAMLGREDAWTVAVGVAATVGHCAPIWHRFRGGKGAATGAGVLLVAQPIAGATAIALHLVFKRLTRRASIGSLIGALGGAIGCGAIDGWLHPVALMAYGLATLVWVRHADNLTRLVRGEELEV
jgi:glycerol-3-phosphate acyltransferase PlsY